MSSAPHTAPVWIEISAKNLIHNVHFAHTFSKKPIAAVVKSNAYGHGLGEIGSILSEQPSIHAFCVFGLEEALKLKKSVPKTPIIVLGFSDFELLPQALAESIECVVHDWFSLNKIVDCCTKEHVKAQVHLKIDTGLARLGFLPHEVARAVDTIISQPCLTLRGVLTHISHTLDEDNLLSSKQLALFEELKKSIRATMHTRHMPPPMFHARASGSMHTTGATEATDDLVRCGTLLYGFAKTPFQATTFTKLTFEPRQVMSLKARIMSVKEVPAGTPIGYGAIEYTTRPTRLAFIPAGYRESYPLALSHLKTHVTIHDKRAPLIGLISMNITAIDVTDIPEAAINDTVTLFGSGPHDVHFASLAAQLHCKPIELTTAVPEHLPRIIVD